jgi:hypothetical protein
MVSRRISGARATELHRLSKVPQRYGIEWNTLIQQSGHDIKPSGAGKPGICFFFLSPLFWVQFQPGRKLSKGGLNLIGIYLRPFAVPKAQAKKNHIWDVFKEFPISRSVLNGIG